MRAMVAAVACAVAAGAGCVPMQRDAFEPAGYTSTHGYEIQYEHGAQRLLPPEWTLDNFERTRGGSRTSSAAKICAC
jgi:hypothetical protein